MLACRRYSNMASKIIRRIIKTSEAPSPVGPYNQAVLVDKTLYISGQIPLDPTTGVMVGGGIAGEAEQCMKNVEAVVKAGGGTMNNLVKTTILLENISDWPAVNTVYEKYFTSHFPARAAYQVAALPKGAKVEIEAVAVIGEIEDVE